MLEFHIHKQVGDFVLEVSLSLEKELAVLFGPSGAGKSLALNTIAGIIRADGGFIRVDGRTCFDAGAGIELPMQERRIGYVFQENSLFPHLTVFENVAYGIRHMPRPRVRSEVSRMLELFRIVELAERYPHQISSGQSQRAAIARAVITRPAVLLMDEPFAALDYPVRSKLRQDLATIQKECPCTILFVTHDSEEAFILGEVIAVLVGGRLVQVGSRDDVFYRPANLHVAELFGFRNILEGEVTGVEPQTDRMFVGCEAGQFALNWDREKGEGDKIRFAIRPEEIKILRSDRSVRPDLQDNCVTARITQVINRGIDYTLLLEAVGEPYSFYVHAPNYAYRDLELSIGRIITVSLRRDAFWIIPCDEN